MFYSKAAVILGTALIAPITGCDSSNDSPTPITAAPSRVSTSSASPSEKYTQTWRKSYGETTCLEYRTVMVGNQTWVMAADMLTNEWSMNETETTPLPPDRMVSDLADQLQTACVPGITDTENMVDVAITLFMLDRGLTNPHFQPS